MSNNTFDPHMAEEFNTILSNAGASKGVFALTSEEAENAKAAVFGNHDDDARGEYLDRFRHAWTSKQNAYHRTFFERWMTWSAPVVDFDPDLWAYQYPTAGASEALRHIIYQRVADHAGSPRIHFFEGEYEGYMKMAEAAGLHWIEHPRPEGQGPDTDLDFKRIAHSMVSGDLFFLSQPSAIDGNVWDEYQTFVDTMPAESLVVDVTYVGSVQEDAIKQRFDLNAPSIQNVVFSLSKPFGVYYDRIGGVFARKEDPGLYGNMWFKNLTSLMIGERLMTDHSVFDVPNRLRPIQIQALENVSNALGIKLKPSQVVLLGNARVDKTDPLSLYLKRGRRVRLCVTEEMFNLLSISSADDNVGEANFVQTPHGNVAFEDFSDEAMMASFDKESPATDGDTTPQEQ